MARECGQIPWLLAKRNQSGRGPWIWSGRVRSQTECREHRDCCTHRVRTQWNDSRICTCIQDQLWAFTGQLQYQHESNINNLRVKLLKIFSQTFYWSIMLGKRVENGRSCRFQSMVLTILTSDMARSNPITEIVHQRSELIVETYRVHVRKSEQNFSHMLNNINCSHS